jgi:hypothetical protein
VLLLVVGLLSLLSCAMVGAGSLMHIKGDGKRYIVHSDELLAAFLELEATLV